MLFICVGNINRSQIAEAIFNRNTKKHKATSAGIKARRKSPLLKSYQNNPIYPMNTLGYDLTNARVKRVNQEMARSADRVVLIFKKKQLKEAPLYLKRHKYVQLWEVDTISDEVAFEQYCKLESRRIKEISKKVHQLIRSLG